MKKRLFIALNLTGEIRKAISERIEKIRAKLSAKEGIRFIATENWHLTLVFLGYQDEKTIPSIEKAIEATTIQFENPEIYFSEISYGPPGQNPRMIWLKGDSTNLAAIKEKLDECLKAEKVGFERENRPFLVHLTLARFEPTLLKSLPVINQKVNFQFRPKSLDLMESKLTPRGANYFLIKALDFGKNRV